MAESNFTQDQYEALNRAIAQGTLTVEYKDKKVTYRSLNEMLRIRKLIGAELGVTAKNTGRRLGTFSKSWPENCK